MAQRSAMHRMGGSLEHWMQQLPRIAVHGVQASMAEVGDAPCTPNDALRFDQTTGATAPLMFQDQLHRMLLSATGKRGPDSPA